MKLVIFLFFFLISNTSIAENIATIDFQKILENSKSYTNFFNDIEKFKNQQLEIFKKIENELLEEKESLDTDKIILSKEEFSNKLNKYENNVKNYHKKVDDINNQIFTKVENAKSQISDQVIIIVQKLSIENNINIVFDSNHYVLAMKEFDITDKVIEILNLNNNKIKIE